MAVTTDEISDICYEIVNNDFETNGMDYDGNYVIFCIDSIITGSQDFKALVGKAEKDKLDEWLVGSYWKDEGALIDELVRVIDVKDLYKSIKAKDGGKLIDVVFKLLN